jgi:hypothetical protein
VVRVAALTPDAVAALVIPVVIPLFVFAVFSYLGKVSKMI